MAHKANGPHQPSGLMAPPLGNIQLQMTLSVYIYIHRYAAPGMAQYVTKKKQIPIVHIYIYQLLRSVHTISQSHSITCSLTVLQCHSLTVSPIFGLQPLGPQLWFPALIPCVVPQFWADGAHGDHSLTGSQSHSVTVSQSHHALVPSFWVHSLGSQPWSPALGPGLGGGWMGRNRRPRRRNRRRST